MYTPRKFWLVLAAVAAAFVIIACSCSNMIPFGKTPTPTEAPFPTLAPLPTAEPFPTTGPVILEGLAGSWLDPDTTGTVPPSSNRAMGTWWSTSATPTGAGTN